MHLLTIVALAAILFLKPPTTAATHTTYPNIDTDADISIVALVAVAGSTIIAYFVYRLYDNKRKAIPEENAPHHLPHGTEAKSGSRGQTLCLAQAQNQEKGKELLQCCA